MNNEQIKHAIEKNVMDNMLSKLPDRKIWAIKIIYVFFF